jgi:hypothetical protein
MSLGLFIARLLRLENQLEQGDNHDQANQEDDSDGAA